MNVVLTQARLILRNDLRLLWRDMGSGKWRTLSRSLGLVGAAFCAANILAIIIFFAVRRTPPLEAETIAWLFFGVIMLGAAMNHAISVLFERADFDLLLAAPISPRAILLARLAAMTCGAALSAAFFLLPLLNGALLALSWHYLAGYVVWLLLAGGVASAGVWLTLLLVQWLGPRRARVWAQVLAAVLGASVYLAIQSHNFISSDASTRLVSQAARALSHPAISFIAHAGRGEWFPLLALALVAFAFTGLTARVLGKMFIGGVQEAGGITSPKKARQGTHVFAGGIRGVTFAKDLRLIARDPLLLAQILPTALYILPALGGFHRLGGVVILAPLALVIATQFSCSLSLVAVAGEECWDLIQMSPTAEHDLRIAKMAAGMALPVALAAVLCVVLATLGRPGLALLTLVFSIGTSAGCSWLYVTRIKPTPRRDIFKRGRRSTDIGRGIVAGILMLIGAGGLGLAGTSHWIPATILLIIQTLGLVACFVLNNIEEVNPKDLVALGTQTETA